MANFPSNFSSFLDHNNNELNWDLLNPFTPINNSSLMQNSIMDYQSLLGFSSDHHLLTQQSQLIQENFSTGVSKHVKVIDPPTISELVDPNLSRGSANTITRNKRKADEFANKSNSSNSSSPMSSDGSTKKYKSERGKKMKTNEKAGENPKEVVHVRARRGEATDSHSIAERIRRGKINERLRCLQDIVPGCNNKTMGMAVMLDEIINYVQSLQNQVEFLSAKLTAASQFHDFNAEIEPEDKMEKTSGSIGNEAQDMESIITKRGYDHIDDQSLANLFQPTWPF